MDKDLNFFSYFAIFALTVGHFSHVIYAIQCKKLKRAFYILKYDLSYVFWTKNEKNPIVKKSVLICNSEIIIVYKNIIIRVSGVMFLFKEKFGYS